MLRPQWYLCEDDPWKDIEALGGWFDPAGHLYPLHLAVLIRVELAPDADLAFPSWSRHWRTNPTIVSSFLDAKRAGCRFLVYSDVLGHFDFRNAAPQESVLADDGGTSRLVVRA